MFSTFWHQNISNCCVTVLQATPSTPPLILTWLTMEVRLYF